MKPIVKGNTIFNWGNIEKVCVDGLNLKLYFRSNRVEQVGFSSKTELQDFVNNLIKELKNG